MKRSCANCDRPLFDTDKVCWHCGYQQFPPTSLEATTDQINLEQSTVKSGHVDDREHEMEPTASGLILFYGILTAIMALALVITVRSLGLSPKIAAMSTSSQVEMVSLISPDTSFAIDIPANWEWQFADGKLENMAAAGFFGNESTIVAAVAPWANLVSDVDYRLVARNGHTILVVARSKRLSRLSSQQIASSLQGEEFEYVKATEVRLLPTGEEPTSVTTNLLHRDGSLVCHQYIVPDSSRAFILSACSQPDSFDQQKEQFEMAQNSLELELGNFGFDRIRE